MYRFVQETSFLKYYAALFLKPQSFCCSSPRLYDFCFRKHLFNGGTSASSILKHFVYTVTRLRRYNAAKCLLSVTSVPTLSAAVTIPPQLSVTGFLILLIDVPSKFYFNFRIVQHVSNETLILYKFYKYPRISFQGWLL